MKRLPAERPESVRIQQLSEAYIKDNKFSRDEYSKYGVKRGLRNDDGTGVTAGLTKICRVHGYMVEDGDKLPDHGKLIYRGISINDIIEGSIKSGTSAFEETVWLLLFGHLPNHREYELIHEILGASRKLPDYFVEDVLMKRPCKDIMVQLSRGVLSLYSFDDDAENLSLENNIRQSLSLIARLPNILSYAYQVKRRHFDGNSMVFHPINETDTTARALMRSVHGNDGFTEEEVRLLDLCLALHAEHGGGNNSTFTSRVLSSADTDIYSTMSAAIGSLKGYKHGGANFKVREMMSYIMEDVENWEDDDEVASCLEKIVTKEGGDKSGLIYGMGHAIYTLSDPRALILKKYARDLAVKKGFDDELRLYEKIEELSPNVFKNVTGKEKVICANVDFYSGLIYQMLGLPEEIFTPLFAVSRISGWCAHRLEEMTTGGRIIRPAYRAIPNDNKYTFFEDRPKI